MKTLYVTILVALFATLGLAPAGAGTVAQWQAKVDAIDQLLREGNFKAARKQAAKLSNRMSDGIGVGENAASSLAAVVGLRAIAEMGLGNEKEADWYWWTAYNIYNDVVKLDVSAYGEHGRVLQQSRFRDRAGKTSLALWKEALGGKSEPPDITKRPYPTYPDHLRSMRIQQSYAVQVVIEADGSISSPLILKPVDHPGMVYKMLDTIWEWKYEPARGIEGEPIAVLWTLTVNFKLR